MVLEFVFFLSQKERRDNARGSIRLKVDEVLKKFDDHLYKFTQTMLTLKQNPLPEKITVSINKGL